MRGLSAKTEELLYFLLWSCETLARPTFSRVDESFEGWMYRNGLGRQLGRLEERKLIEREGSTGGGRKVRDIERAVRLTEAGRLHALGGRDPEACWGREWDGSWHLVLFDLPNPSARVRDSLRLRLK